MFTRKTEKRKPPSRKWPHRKPSHFKGEIAVGPAGANTYLMKIVLPAAVRFVVHRENRKVIDALGWASQPYCSLGIMNNK